MALIDDLQKNITSLEEFNNLTVRILTYLPEVISTEREARGYVIIESQTGSTKKYARPFNTNLFIRETALFLQEYADFTAILDKAAEGQSGFEEKAYSIIDKTAYTIQQSIGIALDLLGNQNSNRKHVGNRFEELVRLIVDRIKIKNKKIVLKIPYTDNNVYSCETDLVFSPYREVRSDNNTIDPAEVVVSLKTSSKDRMGKIFIDKMLMSKFVGHPVKVVGIFLNDIQRKEEKNISYTFVAGLFMVYTQFLSELDGVFFIDPPPNAYKEPYKNHIRRFSDFVLTDARKLLKSTP